MGLLTDTQEIRDLELSRNVYNPKSVYDIDSDVVTTALDAFKDIGFDLRSNNVLNTLERIEDNTQLLQIVRGNSPSR